MKELTIDEMIAALENCAGNSNGGCAVCPFKAVGGIVCIDALENAAADMIRKLKAEREAV